MDFEDAHGNSLRECDIDFATVDVQAVGHLKDVWEMKNPQTGINQYWIRVFMTYCQVFERQQLY